MSETQVSQQIGTYTIDPSHSQVGFTVRHMGFSRVRGRFTNFSGTIQVDPENLSTLEVDVEIEAASIHTGDEKRDGHIRTGDFLSADEHQNLTFKSTGVRDVSGNSFKLDGDLTIRGVTRPVTIEGQYLGEGPDPWGGTRVGFEGSTVINRKDYGVNWNAALETGGFLVGDEVTIELAVQAVLNEE